ncbi:mitochondrial 2-oxodicarboxylate carrier [Drosophila novamexicana]|uniref:mitochondrial 2-oxodicarboxylate carrier n=1 Tax=Drosophila novamexicana TaxID=47314 RepID=UPI0011E5D076|nr:mitochondrial 2-oxodicarboxylate carrier [Drosophila novamexicana]
MSKFKQPDVEPLNEPLPRKIPRLKTVAFQIIASGSSSIFEVFLMLPLDVVKTRLQLQSNAQAKGPNHYRGVLDAFAKIYRQEGANAFWRGVGPLLVSDTPKRAIKFVIFEQSKPYFQSGSVPSPVSYALAGGLGGTIEVLLQNPFEVVKVRQQANRKKKLRPLHVARNIINEGGFGFNGLYKGVTTTMARNFIFHVIYFGFFCSVREATPAFNHSVMEFLRNFTIAYAAGSLGCLLSIPLDVAKTRIQGPQPVPGEIKYAWTYGTLSTVYKEEGAHALYKGLLPQVLRVGPGGAILLLGYEYVTEILVKYFN